jgi:hypothetical protein
VLTVDDVIPVVAFADRRRAEHLQVEVRGELVDAGAVQFALRDR